MMTEIELAWLAGLLEGEGSFLTGPPSAPNLPIIKLAMTDRDVVARVATLFSVQYVEPRCDPRKATWKPVFQVLVKGHRAVGLMKLLRPFMGERRQAQIDRAIASYLPRRSGDNTRKLDVAQVRDIKHRLLQGEPVLTLSNEFKVARKTIRKIRDGITWKAA